MKDSKIFASHSKIGCAETQSTKYCATASQEITLTQTQLSSRIKREIQTIQAMISLYCSAHHPKRTKTSGSGSCAECTALLDYSIGRLSNCKHQGNKPTCGQCSIHCYRPEMQTKIREIMGYSGPRMIWKHPIMAIQHLWDSRKKPLPPIHPLQG